MENVETNAMNAPARKTVIEELYEKGYLSLDARDVALKMIHRPLNWSLWIQRLLLFLGAALVLAGIVFFFAFNWAKIGPFVKFGLIQLGIITCVIASLKKGMNETVSNVLVLSAALLVGVFLAVFGQVYQTGADAYELFIGWTILISGWVLISRFAGLWMMWITLINTSLILYWEQIARPVFAFRFDILFILLAAINSGFLFLGEYGRTKKWLWLEGKWHRRLLLSSILFYLSMPTIVFIVDSGDAIFLAPLALIGAWIGIYRRFRFATPDLVALTLVMLDGCIILLTAIGRGLYQLDRDGIGATLLLSFIVICVFSGATFWLVYISKKMTGEMEHE